MPKINIKSRPSNLGWHFKVVLEVSGNPSEFSVSMDKDFYSRLSTSVEPEAVIRNLFEFLLEKERVEEILPEFDVATVEHYFPEVMSEIQKKIENPVGDF